MVSTGNDINTNEIQEELGPATAPNNYVCNNDVCFRIDSSQRGLLDEGKHGNGYWGKMKGLARSIRYGTSSRLSSTSFVPLVKKYNWPTLWEMFKQWIKDPMNMALLVWIACVAISGAILFLVMTGMLNAALPKKSERDAWFEINNQILNALFTLMALYQFPKRFHHLVLLCRWQPTDISRLRKVYCKNETQKPNERKHMTVVVILLHVNCIAQYVLCGLNIGFSRSKRPAWAVGLSIFVAMAAAAIAGVYSFLSPLGKEYDNERDQEAAEKRDSFIAREDQRTPVSEPQWSGGLFDFWDDIAVAYLSFFCSCCVFGWNMSRLGFGNMYVHIATFILFCSAPFFIFNMAAININSDGVRGVLSVTGLVLCVFGLLYGGFWRIQIRKRFNLPRNTVCCGRASVTDCFQWLFCCSCSLAQEVRTADYYDVGDGKFYMKQMLSDDSRHAMTPLPRENGSSSYRYWGNTVSPMVEEEGTSSMGGKIDAMKPPSTAVIAREDKMLP